MTIIEKRWEYVPIHEDGKEATQSEFLEWITREFKLSRPQLAAIFHVSVKAIDAYREGRRAISARSYWYAREWLRIADMPLLVLPPPPAAAKSRKAAVADAS